MLEGKRKANGNMEDCQEKKKKKTKKRNTVKDYLRNVNSSVSQCIQCIQKPKIASPDLTQYYEGFL